MLRQFFNPRTLKDDLSAGVVLGITSVPDGLAQGVLALVNPIYGLYAYMVGTFSGAFVTGSVFMCVQATGAMSLIVASVPQVTSGEHAEASLFALSMLTGLFMLAAGLAKLGSLARYVSNAVMVGFINAVAVLIILGQLSAITGYNSSGPNKVAQAVDLLRNLDQVDLRTLMVGIVTIVLILTLERTSLKSLGMVVAILAASLLVPLARWDSVALVSSIADIPNTLPTPVLPPLAVFPELIIPAISLAFVGLVQGVGISQGFANPDGKYPEASRDFVGQGVANLASGLFRGMPVGGSMSATSLVVNAGARSRLANLTAGVVMAVVILLFGALVANVALPAMSGLLIVIGVRTLKPDRIEMVWKTGRVQQTVMGITFVTSLLIPLQFAVLVGVALSLVLYVVQQSNRVTVKAWAMAEGGELIEQDAPQTVPAGAVTMLTPYGSLFFATARLVEDELPEITATARHAVVIINLRRESDLGSTFLGVLGRYADRLREQGSKLMLASVSPRAKDELERTGLMDTLGRTNVFVSTEAIGESVREAWHAARAWVAEQQQLAALTDMLEEAVAEELAEDIDWAKLRGQFEQMGLSATEALERVRAWFAEQGSSSRKLQ